MVPVSRLDDPCLVALFKQLPPADKLTARKVCHRWADLVTYAARSTRTLAIFVGDRNLDYFEEKINSYSLGSINVVSRLQKEDSSPMFPLERFNEWNTLQYRGGLDHATVKAIGATFVNIKTLQIGFCDVSSQYDFISRLLEQWAHRQLNTLKMREEEVQSSYLNCGILSDYFADRLFAAINGLSTLKNLHLYLASLPFRDLPIISQLEQLHVDWNGCRPRQFAAMLRQYATAANTSLRSIEYICKQPDSFIEHFTTLGDHLLTCFTRFGLLMSPLNNLEHISAHFRHLTSLRICPTVATTLRRLFDHLSQLTQLLHLCLDIHFAFVVLPDDQPDQLLPQLLSVKALQLELVIHSHRQLEQLKISWTMPNVEAIYFYLWKYSKCTDCAIGTFGEHYLDVIKGNLATFKNCYRQMFAPLKRSCSQLRAILYDREEILGPVDELLAE